MGNLWLKIKVWTKITLFTVVAVYVALFLYHNSGEPVDVWLFFGNQIQRSAIWLATTAFVAGFVAAMLLRTTIVTVRQFKEMRANKQQQKLQRDIADMHSKASMLQTRPAPEKAEKNDETTEH